MRLIQGRPFDFSRLRCYIIPGVVGSLTKHDILREITFDGGIFTVRDLTSNGQPRN